VLVSGHQAQDDDLVEDGPEFVIVEKTGAKGLLVEQRYTR
jgi:hypothetical protein